MGSTKIWVDKDFGSKNVVRKNVWVKKIGSEIFFGQKNFGRKYLGSKKIRVEILFGFIRFVCVKLLLPADLNNNNTECDLGGGGCGWVRTHNLVKPTSTSLWLSWVLIKKPAIVTA